MTHKKFQKHVYKDFLVKKFLKNFGLKFKNKDLFIEALSHSSFANEFKEVEVNSYEKLEFLGDVILNFVLTEQIYNLYGDLCEGELSKLKSAIVAKEPVSELARAVGLEELVLVGRGESKKRLSKNKLGDVFESIVAAIYRAQGIKKVTKFIEKAIALHDTKFEEMYLSKGLIKNFDHKTRLQELTMKLYKVLPEYESKSLENGTFKIILKVANEEISKVESKSKKDGEKQAALIAYNRIQKKISNNKGDEYAH